MTKKIYLAIVLLLYVLLTVVFVALPRTTFSNLEKRDLKQFPTYSTSRLFSGEFTKNINEWFSDSEPYRDQFMQFSMLIDNAMQLHIWDDQVKFHAPENPLPVTEDIEESIEENEVEEIAAATTTDTIPTQTENAPEKRELAEVDKANIIDENAKIANAGIIITGNGPTTRAMMAYSGNSKTGTRYASVVNRYKKTFGNKVNVYCMVIPTAAEYYCPEKAKKCTRPQKPTIQNIHNLLSDSVKVVNIYNVLAQHTNEDIYLRTDHHWAPLGGYYAAQEFAKVADVPFKDLSNYEEKRVKRYVGSMYGYSKDISVKQNPEDFVYHTPNNVHYTTYYTQYTLDDKFKIVDESKPFKGAYFIKYKNGHGGAYCTFMGGDCKITKIKTSTSNSRRLLLLKDSFGNTLPGYLFYSFEEIHIIDFRYFTKNIVDYVEENKISDILFANNTFLLASGNNCKNYERFLVQQKNSNQHPANKD